MEITSRQNERIKFVKKLHRRRYRDQFGLYIAEGLRLVEDLSQSAIIKEVYYTKELVAKPRGRKLIEQIWGAGIEAYSCTESVFAEICDTETAQGILAVVHKPEQVVDWHGKLDRGLVLIADQIRDPGNLGTIIRTASAADVDGIWLVNGTVDPFNPKVVRSSMGAVHKLPFSLVSAESCVDLCRHYGLKLIAADIKDAEPYYNSDLAQPCAVVIGNEGDGVQPTLLKHCDQRVFVPLANEVESLNAAVAAAVLIYESVRQRQFI